MQWNSASEFFAMGGYGLYVWGSFGVTALVLAGEVLSLPVYPGMPPAHIERVVEVVRAALG